MTIRAVIFDFDGTLADTLPFIIRAFQTIFSKYDGKDYSKDEILSMFGPTEDGVIGQHLANKDQVPSAIEEYYSLYRSIHVIDEQSAKMLGLLKAIRAKGIKIGVVTGKSQRGLDISTAAYGLTPYLDFTVTGDDVCRPKPAPEGIFLALGALGVTKEEAIFIGDSNADMVAGRAAGVRTYGAHWLPTVQSTRFGVEPDGVFTEVGPFLELLNREADRSLLWLDWAKQLQSIAQAGLTYGRDVYDLERYEMLRQISVEMMDRHTYAGSERIRMSFAGETGYATPKVDVRGVIFENGKVLLVREKVDGAWSLPGGWADIGYSPSEVAVKEIREESGYEAEPVRLLAVLDKKFHNHPPEPYHIYKIFIQCRITGGQALSGVETSEVRFFGEQELPELSAERNTAKQLQTMFEFLRNPGKPVMLD